MLSEVVGDWGVGWMNRAVGRLMGVVCASIANRHEEQMDDASFYLLATS